MNAARYLLANAGEDSKDVLLTSLGDFSHGDVRRGTAAAQGLFGSCGLAKGDRLILLDHSSFFWVCAYLGTMACGGVSVPLPVNIDHDQFRRILTMTGARGIFIGAAFLKQFGPLLPAGMAVITDKPAAFDGGVPLLSLDERRESTFGTSPDPVEVDEARDMAALMFTSGSTGLPRGVMVSHRNIIANTESIIEYLELTAKDRVMAFLPFYYCFGTSLLHTHLRVGGSLVVENSFLFPNKILKSMVETACTGMAGVPSHYQILLRNSAMKKMVFSVLRSVQQAGGKLHDVYIEELRQALPGTKIYVMYGQTEATARLSYLPPELLERRRGSLGKGIPGVSLEVLNSAGEAVAPGEVGEIVARGDNVTLGYWGDPEATAATFRDGRLFTGDLATVDEDGFISIVERAKDFIKCGGSRVGCRQIEDVVVRFPEMVEVAVLPQFDERLGEAVCLCVVHPSGESIREDLIRFCGQNLPWDQVPRSIHFLPDLPRNFSGKIDKLALKKRYGSKESIQPAAMVSHREGDLAP